jgi:transposase-like protein
MSNDLKRRCKTMIATTEVPVSKFCRRIGISSTAYYRWQNGDLQLGEKTLKAIQADLERLRY